MRTSFRASISNFFSIPGFLVILVGSLVLFGWEFNIEPLKRILPGLVAMNPMTACGFIIAGFALCALQTNEDAIRSVVAGRILASILVAIGTLKLVAVVTGWDPGIDQFLFHDRLSWGSGLPNRMAPNTAFNFLMVGCSLFLLDVKPRRRFWPYSVPFHLSALTSSLAFIGYLYGAKPFIGVVSYIPMALHTALTFLLLLYDIAALRPNRGVFALVKSSTLGGAMARALLPAVVMVPVILGWLRLEGERLAYFPPEVGGALLVVSTILILTGLVTWNAHLLIRMDAKQKQTEADLEQMRDAALESVRLKSEFLSNMSHEIRTPMNGVIGMTGLLQDTSLNREQQDYVEVIRSSGESLLTLINDILDFSKIEAGKVSLEVVDFDLRKVVDEVADLLAEKAHSKGLELLTYIDPLLPARIDGDAHRLRQVLLNLLGNAVKFTECGEVFLQVERGLAPELSSNSVKETGIAALLKFEIRDTGIGISPEEQKRLFQMFVQADGKTTRKYGGTGLGLAICKQLVELMGGQIGVESQTGVGSVFTFVLPLTESWQETERYLPREHLEGIRVLAVDDNETNRKILRHQLTSWGMDYREAENAHQALMQLIEAVTDGRPFDLVLLDMQMPEIDGLMLARLIQSDPLLNQTRRVMLTSMGQSINDLSFINAGIEMSLTKPVKQSQLYDAITSVLAKNDFEEPAPLSRTPADFSTELRVFPEYRLRMDRLLIVEDNPVNQKVAQRQAQKLGYNSDVVSNGLEALHALEVMAYPIILMDCQMPVMDGFEATQAIRKREGQKRNIIIAMTANALTGDREKCLEAGMDDYVSKPVQLEHLEAVLSRWSTQDR